MKRGQVTVKIQKMRGKWRANGKKGEGSGHVKSEDAPGLRG